MSKAPKGNKKEKSPSKGKKDKGVKLPKIVKETTLEDKIKLGKLLLFTSNTILLTE